MRRSKKSPHAPLVITIAGWLGMSLILLAYALNSFTILESSHPLFLSLNLIGALALITETWFHKDFPPVVLNLVWAVIALVGLVRFALGW